MLKQWRTRGRIYREAKLPKRGLAYLPEICWWATRLFGPRPPGIGCLRQLWTNVVDAGTGPNIAVAIRPKAPVCPVAQRSVSKYPGCSDTNA
jgi:hypothetical protein